MDFDECRASSTRARGQSHPVPFPDGSFSTSSGLKSNLIQLGNIWSPFVAPNLALAWLCFAATHLTLHALVLGLECKSAVSITSTKTNLPPQASPVVVVSAVDINGDPIMRHFIECPLILQFHLSLFIFIVMQKERPQKKRPPLLSKSEPTTKKRKHHFSISPLLSLQADSLVFANLPDRVLSISVDPVSNYPIISVFQYCDLSLLADLFIWLAIPSGYHFIQSYRLKIGVCHVKFS